MSERKSRNFRRDGFERERFKGDETVERAEHRHKQSNVSILYLSFPTPQPPASHRSTSTSKGIYIRYRKTWRWPGPFPPFLPVMIPQLPPQEAGLLC